MSFLVRNWTSWHATNGVPPRPPRYGCVSGSQRLLAQLELELPARSRDLDDRDLPVRDRARLEVVAARWVGRVRRRDVGSERIGRDVDVRLVAVAAAAAAVVVVIVVPAARVGREQRVRVRAAGRLDHVEEDGLRRVGDVEDADALVADPLAGRRIGRRGGRRAVLAGLGAVDRLEQERLAAHLVERDIVLRAVAPVVRHDARLLAADVEDPEPAVVAGVREVAVERQVGVRRAVVVGVADQLQILRPGHLSLLLGGLRLGAALRQLLSPLLAYVLLPGYVQLAGFIRMRSGECRKHGERSSGRDERGQALVHAPSQGRHGRGPRGRPRQRC